MWQISNRWLSSRHLRIHPRKSKRFRRQEFLAMSQWCDSRMVQWFTRCSHICILTMFPCHLGEKQVRITGLCLGTHFYISTARCVSRASDTFPSLSEVLKSFVTEIAGSSASGRKNAGRILSRPAGLSLLLLLSSILTCLFGASSSRICGICRILEVLRLTWASYAERKIPLIFRIWPALDSPRFFEHGNTVAGVFRTRHEYSKLRACFYIPCQFWSKHISFLS